MSRLILPVCIDIADMIGKVVTSFSGYDINDHEVVTLYYSIVRMTTSAISIQIVTAVEEIIR